MTAEREAMTPEQVRDEMRRMRYSEHCVVPRDTVQEWIDAIDAHLSRAAEPVCTCSSGDGSLRWPCPRHPPEPADAKDAARYRKLRQAYKALKLYVFDDPNDPFSGDWMYGPKPEDVDAFVDGLNDDGGIAAVAQESGDAKEGEL